MRIPTLLAIALAALPTAAALAQYAPSTWTHPGITMNSTELQEIRRRVQNNIQPQRASWDALVASNLSSLSYTDNSRAIVDCDGGTSGGFTTDGMALYSLALRWYVSGDEAYARKAIDIMNRWSSRLTTIRAGSGQYVNQHVLVTGWVGHHFAEAAEIIVHTYSGWQSYGFDFTRYKNMLTNIFYPNIDNGATENGNFEASCIQSILAIGVLTENATIFNRGVSMARNEGGGSGAGSIPGYICSLTGQAQEACRDSTHTQMGLGELVQAAEIAWKQGVNLYGAFPDGNGVPRLAKGLIYAAQLLRGQSKNTNDGCGSLFAKQPNNSPCGTLNWGSSQVLEFWEIAHNHYNVRQGLGYGDISYIAITESRPENVLRSQGEFAWASLTHGELASTLPVTLVADVFDAMTTGSAPSGWTVTNDASTTCTVQNIPSTTDKSMRFTDSNSSGYSRATKTFSAQSGPITVEWRQRQDQQSNWNRFFIQSGSTVAVELYTTNSPVGGGSTTYGLYYRNASGNDVLIQALSAATWYDVRVVAKPSSDTADIYVNGILRSTNAPFRTAVGSLDRVLFGTGGSTAQSALYIDDVTVIK
jgi:hypothetical protein